MIKILITKSVNFSSFFFKKVFLITSCDFLSVKYSILQKKKPIILNDRFIFTSYNGIKGFIYNFGKDLLKKKKFYVVGEKTYLFIKNFGNFSFLLRKNYVQDLIDDIILKNSNKSYDWFCGKNNLLKNSDDKVFQKKNILLNRYEVYQTFFLPHKIENLSSYHGIIFFSPSGAKSFFLKNRIRNDSKTEFFAIGKTTAEFVSRYLNKEIWIPDIPSMKEVLLFVKKFFDKKNLFP
ncbi:uroporphyrinogen-III synthase [Blattabacterium cuenoti]|uniref:uroporphyrinogen-III synthase n=1 Tax=Blattabacterium cuenoti TaxID=1653831 RepID=UPI00163BF850|nr:uroporphyrinogen-III synthase [Blattabacterium cuenoti]